MKEKISITLDSGLVSDLNKTANSLGIGRSTYIEQVLLNETKQTPIVIFASFSTINNKEKSLMRYKNEPLIKHQLNYLKIHGFNNIYVATDSKELKSMLEKEHPNVQIIYDTKKKGSGYNLKLVANELQRTFAFLYCDIILDLDLNNLIRFHRNNRAGITLVLQSQKNVRSLGVAILEGSRIIAFEEKPDKTNSHLAFIGCGVIKPSAMFQVKDEKFELQLNNIENKYGYIFEGQWKDFNEKEDFL